MQQTDRSLVARGHETSQISPSTAAITRLSSHLQSMSLWHVFVLVSDQGHHTRIKRSTTTSGLFVSTRLESARDRARRPLIELTHCVAKCFNSLSIKRCLYLHTVDNIRLTFQMFEKLGVCSACCWFLSRWRGAHIVITMRNWTAIEVAWANLLPVSESLWLHSNRMGVPLEF